MAHCVPTIWAISLFGSGGFSLQQQPEDESGIARGVAGADSVEEILDAGVGGSAA